MSKAIGVRLYEDGNDGQGTLVGMYAYAKVARAAGAAALGKKSLRGAASWDWHRGGTAYQFGRAADTDRNPFVVIAD